MGAAEHVTEWTPVSAAVWASFCAASAVSFAHGSVHTAWESERRAQVALVRDIFGNPFRPPPAIDPTWLSSNDGHVFKLATAIYNDRAFDRLPALAAALEAAGCKDAESLDHLRRPGPHVRGCWAVDAVLGKS
jgi:hypothetical protein